MKLKRTKRGCEINQSELAEKLIREFDKNGDIKPRTTPVTKAEIERWEKVPKDKQLYTPVNSRNYRQFCGMLNYLTQGTRYDL